MISERPVMWIPLRITRTSRPSEATLPSVVSPIRAIAAILLGPARRVAVRPGDGQRQEDGALQTGEQPARAEHEQVGQREVEDDRHDDGQRGRPARLEERQVARGRRGLADWLNHRRRRYGTAHQRIARATRGSPHRETPRPAAARGSPRTAGRARRPHSPRDHRRGGCGGSPRGAEPPPPGLRIRCP